MDDGFPNVKTVELSNGIDIKVYDLTYGYLLGVDSGDIVETKEGTIVDATDLTEVEVLALRSSDVTRLYNTVLQLTYPALYNEDGTVKEQKKTKGSGDSKKKV